MKAHKKKSSKGKKTAILLGIVVVLFVLFLPRYLIQRAEHEKIVKEASAIVEPTFSVMRMKADKKDIKLILPSYLEPIHFTPILARINGYLKEYLVDIGDRVKKGQLLAIIENPETDEELCRIRDDLLSFQAKEDIARITAIRWTELYKQNPEALSKEEVDQMVAAYESAAADAAAAAANVKRWEYLDHYKFIYAPYDGIITKRPLNLDLGTLITAGNFSKPVLLFEMAHLDVLRAFVDVPQSLFYLIKDGGEAVATVWEFPGKAFKGIVDRNASALDPKARTMLTQVNIDNKSGLLTSGLYASVEFKFKPEHPVFLVPVGALIIRSGPPYLAVVANNAVQLKQVKIGRDYGRTLEIIEGLNEEDEIIINPTDRLKNGLVVKPVLISKDQEGMLMN